jgi:hypothetical protein
MPWNEALAKISLVANRAVVEAAGEIDAVFWQHSDRIDRGEITDETTWFAATEPMEVAWLAFVNTTKRHVWGSSDRLDRLPIRRPTGYMPGVGTRPVPPTLRVPIIHPARSSGVFVLVEEAAESITNRGIDRLPSVGRQTVPGRGGGAEMAGGADAVRQARPATLAAARAEIVEHTLQSRADLRRRQSNNACPPPRAA